jgi:DNA topoisomerase-6 subunit B
MIEVALAYGNGEGRTIERKAAALAEGETHEEETELARVMRYANRVPLLYQQAACSAYKSVLETAWKNYGVSQSRGALPQGPMVIFIHMASVWVPFTSESKEAIADYDEIRKEMKLALQECGRRLSTYLRKKAHAKSEHERRNIFALYIEEVAHACGRLKQGKIDADKLKRQLMKIAVARTGGSKTDALLAKKHELPDELPHSIIVTPEGAEGEVPAVVGE